MSSFSFLAPFFAGNKEKENREKAERLKEELLATIRPLDRGVDATAEDKERVEKVSGRSPRLILFSSIFRELGRTSSR